MSGQKHILITGGLGYIGSHAVVAFEQAGYRTIIIDNLVNSSKNVLLGIEKILGYCPEFYECDIRDRAGLETIFGKYSIEGVIHFAAKKFVTESIEHPLDYYDNNVTGSLVLLGVMQDHCVNCCVFSSTAGVYDSDNLVPPFDEESTKKTLHPYANSKLLVESVLDQLGLYTPMKAISLRYFNVIGAHESGLIGDEYFSHETNAIGYIYRTILGKQEYFSIYGTDFRTPDGTALRDYIDVWDLVTAHIYAYKKLDALDGSKYIPINLGTSLGVSVAELVSKTEEVVGKKVNIAHSSRRPGDVSKSIASCDRAMELLEWQASTPIQVSIARGWNYILNNSII